LTFAAFSTVGLVKNPDLVNAKTFQSIKKQVKPLGRMERSKTENRILIEMVPGSMLSKFYCSKVRLFTIS
jgi:hypothetical protein